MMRFISLIHYQNLEGFRGVCGHSALQNTPVTAWWYAAHFSSVHPCWSLPISLESFVYVAMESGTCKRWCLKKKVLKNRKRASKIMSKSVTIFLWRLTAQFVGVILKSCPREVCHKQSHFFADSSSMHQSRSRKFRRIMEKSLMTDSLLVANVSQQATISLIKFFRLKRLGIDWSKPRYPETNGIEDRFNGRIEEVLHHHRHSRPRKNGGT